MRSHVRPGNRPKELGSGEWHHPGRSLIRTINPFHTILGSGENMDINLSGIAGSPDSRQNNLRDELRRAGDSLIEAGLSGAAARLEQLLQETENVATEFPGAVGLPVHARPIGSDF